MLPDEKSTFREQICKYIGGKSNQVSFPDPHQNIENVRYQLVGSSCDNILGYHVFDPLFLKLSCVSQ